MEKFVASEPGVQFAALYYKPLEIERDLALKLNKGDFDAVIHISVESRLCIQWWIDNVQKSFRYITVPKPDRRIESDSSGTGWGVMMLLIMLSYMVSGLLLIRSIILIIWN